MTEQDNASESKHINWFKGTLMLTLTDDPKEGNDVSLSCTDDGISIEMSLKEARWLYRVLGEALALSKEN